jgi:hypothetical protein
VPADFAGWGLHCFCPGATRTPQAIVRMDDDGRLLWRAAAGARRGALGGCDSQIALLEAFRLLARDGEDWRPTFPSVAAGPLRAAAAAVVAPGRRG